MATNPGILGYYPQEKHWVPVPADKSFTAPYSELAMSCGFAGKKVTHVIVSPKVNYAYVKFEDTRNKNAWNHGLLNEVIPPHLNDWAASIAWKE